MSFTGTNTVVTPLTGSRDLQLGDAGNYYTIINVPGTAVAGHAAATTFDQTKALLYLFNNGSSIIYPVQLRLTLTNAGTNGTTMRFEQVIDKGPTRYSSGGTSFSGLGTNLTNGSTSKASVVFGAAVLTANTASSRTVCDGSYRAVIGVVGDTYSFNWGVPQMGPQSAVTQLGTTVSNIAISYPPLAINPNEIFAIHQWSPSQSGAYQFEFEFDYIEK
jgi:hypothetical protein